MLLTGTYSRSIDDKARVAIPKRLREAMACERGGVLYVAPSTDRSLGVYTEASFGELAERLRKSSPTEQHVRAFTRLFFAAAQQVELDGQGRIRIPAELVRLAALEKEIVLIGVQDHLEIWSAKQWEAYQAEKQAHFDEIAEAAFGDFGG
jgi:MraZ protein